MCIPELDLECIIVGGFNLTTCFPRGTPEIPQLGNVNVLIERSICEVFVKVNEILLICSALGIDVNEAKH